MTWDHGQAAIGEYRVGTWSALIAAYCRHTLLTRAFWVGIWHLPSPAPQHQVIASPEALGHRQLCSTMSRSVAAAARSSQEPSRSIKRSLRGLLLFFLPERSLRGLLRCRRRQGLSEPPLLAGVVFAYTHSRRPPGRRLPPGWR